MSDSPEKQTTSDGELEELIHGVARGQPLRRAPVSLEHRVLAQLEHRRASLSWWRKGFTSWPLPARAGFLVASLGFVWLAITGVMFVLAYLDSGEVAGSAVSWLQLASKTATAVTTTASFLLSSIPPAWLYGTAAAAAALYALLFGLGTVAYRTLYVER